MCMCLYAQLTKAKCSTNDSHAASVSLPDNTCIHTYGNMYICMYVNKDRHVYVYVWHAYFYVYFYVCESVQRVERMHLSFVCCITLFIVRLSVQKKSK